MEISFDKLPQAVSQINERLQNIERLLMERSNESKSDSNELLNIEQASKHLNVSVATIYTYVHERVIPFSKVKKRLYFSKQELTEWVKTGRKKTITEVNASAEELLKPRKK